LRTLLDPNLPFFKGNLHMHTTRSDGRLSPDEALARYQARGYDFVALADHWMPSEAGRVGGMTVLTGVELDTNVDENQVAHIVGAGFDPDKLMLPDERASAQALIDAINRAGGIAILAHPSWSMNTVEFIRSLHGLTGAEVYNTFSGIPWNAGRADSSHVLDLTASMGCLMPLVAADDSHRYGGEEGVSYTMVNARENTPEALLEALRAGRFYASQGPSFRQITLNGREAAVECSPSEHVVFYSNLQWGSKRCVSGRDLTHARYQMDEKERFLRVELIDRFGRRAWSSPVAV
jgi:hypothetical protein